jgi:hypothetical protein
MRTIPSINQASSVFHQWTAHTSNNARASSDSTGSAGSIAETRIPPPQVCNSGSSKGNRLLITKIRELTTQVSEGRNMIESLEQRIKQLETAPVVATATATACAAPASSAEPTLTQQLLEMGFNHKEILTIPPGTSGIEEAANFLFN